MKSKTAKTEAEATSKTSEKNDVAGGVIELPEAETFVYHRSAK